jgi:hypothetical protein
MGNKIFTLDTCAKYLANPENPVLISLGRTGNHWLRFMIEVVTGRPTLRHTMLHDDSDDFLLIQDHDWNLDLVRENVIYLYRRSVVDAVYSYVSNPNGTTRDVRQILPRAGYYARHMARWILDERFTKRKTIITYEDMQRDSLSVIVKVTDHLDVKVNLALAALVAKVSTKERIHAASKKWSPGLVPTSAAYQNSRERFRLEWGDKIRDAFIKEEPERLDDYVDWINTKGRE